MAEEYMLDFVKNIKETSYRSGFIFEYREFCKKNNFVMYIGERIDYSALPHPSMVSITLSGHLKTNITKFHEIIEWIVKNTNGMWDVDDVRMSANRDTQTFQFQSIFSFSFEDISDATYFKLRF